MTERLKYHQAALELSGKAPLFSQTNLQALRDFEQNCQIKLPPSLREWYSLEQSEAILHEHSNGDHPVKATELGSYYLQSYPAEYCHPLQAAKLLTVMGENQGCFDWLVYLDGSDDPPVYVTAETLELFTPRFSDFIYTHVWDWQGLFSERWESLMAPHVSKMDLAFLRRHFKETTRTFSFDYVGGAAYRFYRDDKCILLKTDRGKQAGYDTWHVWAASTESLAELVNSLKEQVQFVENVRWYWDEIEPNEIPF